MKYRPEIDGLRAVAVIPVILFHAGFEYFSGGFVGVDVFFVISGYLITTIILSEKEQGTFSLVNFYDRRARRILPALFLVMLASLPFAWLWLFPSDMKDFSRSMVAVSIFSSNILFWLETGYWDVENELKPLIHTWSLAVEEQYYVLFPLFIILMWKFRKRWILSSLILLAAMSLVISQWGAYNEPEANFFLLPTRAWEIAIGASIAFYFLYRKQAIRTLLSHKFVDESLSLFGLVLIGYAVFSFDEGTPFPSFFALIPTIGAGLTIIFSSPQTLVGRLLASKYLVGIGLISYSAYLWHQPLLAFARHRSITEPNEFLVSVLVLLTFPLAYISWRYVEKPFRTNGLLSRKAILMFGVIGSAMFFAIGMVGHFTDGFNGLLFRDHLTRNMIEEKLKVNRGLSDKCVSFTLVPDCRTSDDPEILVWGDSFAMHLVQGIMASSQNPKIIQMTKTVCGPFFDIAPVTPKTPVRWAKNCLKFTGKVRKWIKANTTVKYVVVSSPFNQYLSKNSKLLFRGGELKDANINTVTIEFNKTLSELKSMGVTPIVFSPPPANGIDLGRCLAKAEWMGLSLDECNFNVNDMYQSTTSVYNFLENIKESHRVIRLDKLICENDQCKTHLGSTWIFRDKFHLSNDGSAVLGERHNFYSIVVNNGKGL